MRQNCLSLTRADVPTRLGVCLTGVVFADTAGSAGFVRRERGFRVSREGSRLCQTDQYTQTYIHTTHITIDRARKSGRNEELND